MAETATKQRASRIGAELIHCGTEYFKRVAFILSPAFFALRKGYEREQEWIKPCLLFFSRPQLPPHLAAPQACFLPGRKEQQTKDRTANRYFPNNSVKNSGANVHFLNKIMCAPLYNSKVML